MRGRRLPSPTIANRKSILLVNGASKCRKQFLSPLCASKRPTKSTIRSLADIPQRVSCGRPHDFPILWRKTGEWRRRRPSFARPSYAPASRRNAPDSAPVACRREENGSATGIGADKAALSPVSPGLIRPSRRSIRFHYHRHAQRSGLSMAPKRTG